MRNLLPCTLPCSLALLAFGLLGLSIGGCGGVETVADAGTGEACTLATPGKSFTFHVTNTGKEKAFLGFGCGATLPIDLETAGGKLRIGPGNGSGFQCEYTCEQIYAGAGMYACSDCGGGNGKDLAPGATVDIVWDRRVYTDVTAKPECVDGGSATCALGKPVEPSGAQKGVLTVCPSSDTTSPAGWCSNGAQVSFEVDTTGDEASLSYP